MYCVAVMQCIKFSTCRVVIGAPRGTFPGGLNLTDTVDATGGQAVDDTGLVYSCSVSGICEGVRGDTSLYLPPTVTNASVINGVITAGIIGNRFFDPTIGEGRLFDQGREFLAITSNTCMKL